MFNPFQLRAGDTALVQVDERQVAFEVVRRGKTYLSPIWLRPVFKSDYPGDLVFDSRSNVSAIVAGARRINGDWQPL